VNDEADVDDENEEDLGLGAGEGGGGGGGREGGETRDVRVLQCGELIDYRARARASTYVDRFCGGRDGEGGAGEGREV